MGTRGEEGEQLLPTWTTTRFEEWGMIGERGHTSLRNEGADVSREAARVRVRVNAEDRSSRAEDSGSDSCPLRQLVPSQGEQMRSVGRVGSV